MTAPLMLAVLILQGTSDPFHLDLQALERQSGGRLGVSVLEVETGRTWGYRAQEPFPMCSTFKVLLAGAALAQVDAGKASLEHPLPFGSADLLAHAPVARGQVAAGHLTLGQACAAAVEVSDNTAANLILRFLGGPGRVTAFARQLGDGATRLDRWEPDLNEAAPGDPRDTTTPEAMRRDVQGLLFGTVLAEASRQRLAGWMAASRTGDRRLRAGLPPSWAALGKTGAGARGTTNDVVVATAPGGRRVIIAAYLTGARGDGERVLEGVGRVVAKTLAR